ncbi:DNA-binding FadR family transcriptional regulator [Streptomyces sp. 3330]|uniref:FCD domain-containing protein n=1 Tax=Streptomyces sp. 3330 TaxID=2817755 RepID=UPI00286159F6|nr:FCD domain-containing protein [Streptomyces sp. 3330]MDR6977472.1 DNA-binding FadR family transcriptional regulator [Streptomyces sp. 3330]
MPFQRRRQVDALADPPEHVTAMRPALQGRRAASAGNDEVFVDADVAFHAAVVAAARNPVPADLSTEFVPVLRTGPVELLAPTCLRVAEPDTADEAREALVRAVEDGYPEAAAAVLTAEPEDPFGGR